MSIKINYIIFICICILFILISYFTPYQSDDLLLILKSGFRDYKIGISDNYNFNNIIDFCINHYRINNGRLGDISSFITLGIFPKWLFSIFTGFFVGLTFYISSKLLFNRFEFAPILLMGVLIFALPYNNLFIPIFSINYLWSCALSILALYIFIKNGNGANIILKMLFYLVMFIAGAMHEGFSITTGCIMFIFLIFNKHEKATKYNQLLLFGCFCLGALFPLLSPGIWHRNSTSPQFSIANLFSVWTFIHSWGFWIYTSMLIISISIKKLSKKLSYENKLILFSFFIAGLLNLIIVKWSPLERNFFFGQFFSLLGISLIIYNYCVTKYISYISYFSFILTFSHLYIVLTYQIKLNNEFNSIKNKYELSDNGTVYIDFLKTHQICPFTLNKPVNTLYYMPLAREYFERFYGPSKKLSLIPTEIKYININANNTILDKIHSVYYINNNLISSNTLFWENGAEYVVYTTLKRDGLCCPTVIANHFENDYGIKLVYLQPKFVWRHQYKDEILTFDVISKVNN